MLRHLLLLTALLSPLAMRPLAADATKQQCEEKPRYVLVTHGRVSYYGQKHQGKKMANGQRFDKEKLTCAHRTLRFGTKLRLTTGGKSVLVTVTDRGPYCDGRVVDLSEAAFRALAPVSRGVLKHVKVEKQVN